MKPWFTFQQNAASDPSVVEIHIIDFIGGWIDDIINRVYNEEIGVTARAFVDQLSKLPDAVKAIHVHINSPGGDVQGGINIANALRAEIAKGRAVTTFVDGMAASIASVIAMAGQKVVMADNALMMVHNPWGWEIGEASDMRKYADILDSMRDQIVATYKWHTKDLSDKDIQALMNDETWMTADEALAYGFATDKVEGLKAAASITRASVKKLKVPEQYQARVEAFLQPAQAPAPAPAAPPAPAATAEELLPLCQTAGASLAFTSELLAAKLPLEQATARIDADKTTREAAAAAARDAEQRASGIRAACALAKVPQLADGYIAGAMPVDAVKAHLTTVTALVDGKLQTDGSLLPDDGPSVAASWKAAIKKNQSMRAH
jgi:ATP-dependent protease ClpP protease subunit